MDKDREEALAKRIGQTIAERRRAAGLTQEGLAELLDCGNEAISRMERGAITLTVPRLVEVAEALGCPAYVLLQATSDLPDDQAIAIGRKLAQVNSTDREMVLGFVDKLTTRLKTPR